MPGAKTNERVGTRAVLRFARISPYKVREVLDLIRNRPVGEAEDILRFSDRDAAIVVGKLLHSAIANAESNDQQDAEDLYVSACFADEGTTIKRWRPRARGRATRIRKRTSHITIIVSRLPDEELARLRSRRQAEQAARRARRVAGARRSEGARAARRRRRGGEAAPAEATAAAEDVDESVDEEAPGGTEAGVAEDDAGIEQEEDRADEAEAAEADAEDAVAGDGDAEAAVADGEAEEAAPEVSAAPGEETPPERADEEKGE